MNTPLLECVEAGARDDARYAVIWLHGLGADGYDFLPIVEELELPPEPRIRFVFPHAPRRPVTVNGGQVMRAWYDIPDLTFAARSFDEAGIRESARHVTALLEREEARGVPSERVLLAGFSQGGALAIHVALRHPRPLLGLIALSCYALLPDALAAEASPASRALPVFMAHGTDDPIVPLAAGEDAAQRLRELGVRLTWATYRMPHAVHPSQIEDIGRWMRTRTSSEPVP